MEMMCGGEMWGREREKSTDTLRMRKKEITETNQGEQSNHKTMYEGDEEEHT